MAEAWTMQDPCMSFDNPACGSRGTISVAFPAYKAPYNATAASSSTLYSYTSFAMAPTSHFSNSLQVQAAATSFATQAFPSGRAQSEPPASGILDTDVDMDPPLLPLKRSQSHWNFTTMPADRMSHASSDNSPLPEIPERESQSQSQRRSASPAPTEVEDPEPEYVANALHSRGIKVVDFAYQPDPALKPIRELFDQFDALSEYEYRLSQRPRQYPIQGKTLQRLVAIKWIDMEEIQRRCHEMDLEELRKVDTRPAWPFALKYRGVKAESVPKPPERIAIMESRRFQFVRMDRMRRMAEFEMARQEKETREAEMAMRSIEERLTQSQKRHGEYDGEGSETVDQKRRRMEEEPESQPSCQRVPQKQYPAPLSSYDPEIYPEAASIIEFQSQSQSQPRPVVPPRFDTPPLEEEEEDLPPNALRRPNKGLKRTLSRTQTFSQL